MKQIVLLAFFFSLFSFSFAQTKKEYQDPAFWIDLDQKKDGITVKLTSLDGKENYLYAPVKLLAKDDGRLVPLKISLDSIIYETVDKSRQIVYLDGKIDLSCCRNRPLNMELYDKDDNLIQYARTESDGSFKLKSINGNILEIKNKKIKFNFKKIKTIDVNLDERFASLERNKTLSREKIQRLRKREKTKIRNN